MCRISCIKGNLNRSDDIKKIINTEQQYGGSLNQEVYMDGDLTIFLNRFDVTSTNLKMGEFPIVTDRYVFTLNGEIYCFRDHIFNQEHAKSDAHFALPFIEEFGHEAFFREADIEGTFFIYDRKQKVLYVYVDQLNTKGCFYSITPGNIIVSQELSTIKKLMDYCHSKKDTTVYTLKRGCYLKINPRNELSVHPYKTNFNEIWKGLNKAPLTELSLAITRAVKNRIPSHGKFGLLCSGGVDSSLLFKIVFDHLRVRKQLDRLVVFTLGLDANPLKGEENDLENVYALFAALGIDQSRFLKVVFPMPNWDEYLIKNQILGKDPHLISPNPVPTQVRHIVTMSAVLAQIALACPELKVVISGDFADEIFGGYNSMHNGNKLALVRNIQEKLDDLHLNDASRVTLASLRGCKFLVESLINKRITTSIEGVNEAARHPIEVRTPYASHFIADALSNFSYEQLVGKHNDRTYSKYVLRLTAEKVGVPLQMAWRKKMPFNEGGTGVRNTEPYHKEEEASIQFLEDLQKEIGAIDHDFMDMFSIKKYSKNNTLVYEYALYCASMLSGLKPLIKGGTFRESMPDSNYTSRGNLDHIYST